MERTRTLPALAAGLVLMAGCADETPPQVRNVVLVTLDTTRADALGCYGRSPSVTPILDALARESLLYANAHTVAPLTTPAHASMLTGLVPARHSVRDNGSWPLPQAAQSIAESARERGLRTAAFVSSSVLDRSFGLAQGFEVYDGPVREERATTSRFNQRSAAETTRAALRWLRSRDPDQRFLLWVHYFDPHAPYAAPQSFVDQTGDPYLAEVAFVDNALGELLAELREDDTLDSTLLIVLADHGEALGEHGEPTHGTFCYEGTLRVPFLVRYPDGGRAGEVSREFVSVADVAPTVVEALELGSIAGVDGLSLFERHVPSDRGTYFECYAGYFAYGWSPLSGWVDPNGKYVASSAPELYDLGRDPSETTNLLPQRESVRLVFERAMRAALQLPALERDDSTPIDAELARELRALGYAGAGTLADRPPAPLERTDLPSPRDCTAELNAILQATALLDQRAFAEAVPLLESVVGANPRNAFALDQLAFAAMQLDRFEQARAHLEQRLTLGRARLPTLLNLATCAERLGDTSAALAYAQAALELDERAASAREIVERLGTR